MAIQPSYWIQAILFTLLLGTFPISAQLRWDPAPDLTADLPESPTLRSATNLQVIDGKFIGIFETNRSTGSLVLESTDGQTWNYSHPTDLSCIDVRSTIQLEADLGRLPVYIEDFLFLTFINGKQSLLLEYRNPSGKFRATICEGDLLSIPDSSHELIDSSDTSPSIEILTADYCSPTAAPLEEILQIETFQGDYVLLGSDRLRDLEVAYPEGDDWTTNRIPYSYSSQISASPKIATNQNTCVVSTAGNLLYTNDLQNWTPINPELDRLFIYDLKYKNGLYVAVGYIDDYTLGFQRWGLTMASIDGINWAYTFHSDWQSFTTLTYANGKWAAGGQTGKIHESLDGYAWTETSDLGVDVSSLAGGAGYWLAGTIEDKLYSSPDLVNWTLQHEDAGKNIAFNGSIFLLINENREVYTSPIALAGTADIIDHPDDAVILPGTATTLSVNALGDGSITYQWYRGTSGDESQPLIGATSSTYQTPNLTETTSYWVQAQNSIGSDISTTAQVIIATTPIISNQPQGIVLNMGDYEQISVTATGGGLSYQWFQGLSGDTSTPVTNATGNGLVIPDEYPGTFNYWVQVSNIAGVTNSSTSIAQVLPVLPIIGSWQTEVSTNVWDYEPLFISTYGTNITRQWYQGVSGDTSTPVGSGHSFFTPDNDTVGVTKYWVRVSNPAGYVDTETVTYTVFPVQPYFTALPPSNHYLELDEYLSLVVSASPFNERSYQWYEGETGDTSIPLDDDSSLYQQYDQAGIFRYWVRVTNPYGSADSPTFYVRVYADQYSAWAEAQGLPIDGTGIGHVLATTRGEANIIRYAQGLDLDEESDWQQEPFVYQDPNSGESYLAIWIRTSTVATDITVGAQESTSPNSWTNTAVDTGLMINHGDQTVSSLFRCFQPFSAGGTRFLRASITYSP